MSPTLTTDGSATADRRTRSIDLENAVDRWRYTCAHGHRNWDPTNGGVWCRSCSRDHAIEDPHHYELVDQRTGERVPWSAVELANG